MPQISQKGQQMPESPIRKLVPYAEAAKQAGKHVFHLNIGQPDVRTPEVAIKRMHALRRQVIEYSHSAGFASYRAGLCRYYARHNIALSPDEVIVTTGGSEALLFAFNTCFDPGDELIIPEPFYANYNGFASSTHVNVVPIQSSIEQGFALPPIAQFEAAITSRTKGILICNPSNPTGYLYTRDELQTLRDIVRRHDLYLLADEVYREFVYDGRSHHSVLNLADLEDHVVVVDSVSKRYSMCGARIGCLISRNRDVMHSAMKFAQARLSPPTLAQLAAEAALDTPDVYFSEVLSEYVSRRDIVVARMNAMDGVICPKPQGAFYCMAELPVDDAESFCRWLLESFDLDNKTVMLAPAAGFYSTPDVGKCQVRIAYVLEGEALNQALDCLERALLVYPGRHIEAETISPSG